MTGRRLRISIAVAVAVIAGVSALAAYANVQLLSSASQHDRVGQLTPVLPHANPAPRPKPAERPAPATPPRDFTTTQNRSQAQQSNSMQSTGNAPRHSSMSTGASHSSSHGGDQHGSSAPDRPAEDPQSGHDDSPKPDDD